MVTPAITTVTDIITTIAAIRIVDKSIRSEFGSLVLEEEREHGGQDRFHHVPEAAEETLSRLGLVVYSPTNLLNKEGIYALVPNGSGNSTIRAPAHGRRLGRERRGVLTRIGSFARDRGLPGRCANGATAAEVIPIR